MRNHFLFFIFSLLSCASYGAFKSDAMIPPVVITANKNAHHTVTHAPKTIITQKTMQSIGATSLAQALQELGGVQLQDLTGNGSQVLLSMRGFGVNASSNTLLLINGIPITNPDLAPPDLNAIPLQEIEYIEVTTGTESVLYGDQAVGGTINIVTHQETKNKFGLSCSAGSYNQRTCHALLNKQYKKIGVHLGGLVNDSDNYRHHNNYHQNLLSGKADYSYLTGNLVFNFQLANEKMLYPGALTAAQVRQNRQQASNNTDYFTNWNGLHHLRNQQQINANWKIETDLARREMHGNGVLMAPFTQSRVIHFIKPQLRGNIGKNVLITGVEFENDRYDLNSLFGVTDDSQQKYSLFGIFNAPINDRLSLSLGARGAQQNNRLETEQTTHSVNKALATTLGATFQLNSHLQAYLRRAESFRFPKAEEDASAPIGSHGLKTQRGVSYETGAQLDYKRTSTKLGLYQLNLRDEITFDPTQTALQPFGSNRNLSPTVRRGFSLSEKLFVIDNIALDGQYNYVNARFQQGINAGNRIPLVSENIFRSGINYAFAEHWNVYAEGIYTGNQFAANDDANLIGKIGGYTVYNANLRYRFKQLTAAFRANNIFNKYFYFYTAYQTSPQEIFYYPAPGRNFLLTLTYDFV